MASTIPNISHKLVATNKENFLDEKNNPNNNLVKENSSIQSSLENISIMNNETTSFQLSSTQGNNNNKEHTK